MELQANKDVLEETSEGENNDFEKEDSSQNVLSNVNIRTEGKKYGKKFSARLYKYFSLWTFFIYYFNFLLRIGMRSSNYFKEQGITDFSVWWAFVTDKTKCAEMGHAVFDWYTITLLVFLFLYSAVFLITFIRFSPKNKKTFKYFKKGFVMARRVIKLISVGLTLTVLVNSAQLATFSDKFMFVISLLAIMFTFMQICVSVTSWVVGRKLNRSVKHYVGNVMSNYIATSRVNPQNIQTGRRKATVGDKLDRVKGRFLRTIETLILSDNEALRNSDADDYVVDAKEITDRFENDYQPNDEECLAEEQNKKFKKTKFTVKKDKSILTKKEKTIGIHKKVKIGKLGKSQENFTIIEDNAEREQLTKDDIA